MLQHIRDSQALKSRSIKAMRFCSSRIRQSRLPNLELRVKCERQALLQSSGRAIFCSVKVSSSSPTMTWVIIWIHLDSKLLQLLKINLSTTLLQQNVTYTPTRIPLCVKRSPKSELLAVRKPTRWALFTEAVGLSRAKTACSVQTKLVMLWCQGGAIQTTWPTGSLKSRLKWDHPKFCESNNPTTKM